MSSPAGWYQDPRQPSGQLRYWDGTRWTGHQAVAPPAGGVPTGRTGSPAAAWVRRHKLTSALVALVVLGWTMDAAAGDEQSADRGPVSDGTTSGQSGSEPGGALADDQSSTAEPARSSREGKEDDRAGRDKQSTPGPSPTPNPEPKPKPTRAAEPRTYLVTRVIDGDTIELGNGAGVRIVGIDTPEVGQCGYDAATSNMARLVLNRRVRLTRSDEDKDHYGRWLRYVNVGAVDAGLRQIKQGFAIARYDSRDGYGFHVRESIYIAADRASKGLSCPEPAPAPNNGGGGAACAPGYNPCVPVFPPDVDCADVDGPVQVRGVDPHGLDADGDGVACE